MANYTSNYTGAEIDAGIAAAQSAAPKMEVVTLATAQMNLDVEPNKIYVYQQAQTKQNQIYVTMDEDVWTTGDRAVVIFSKTEASSISPALRGYFGLPVVLRGQDYSDAGQLMGAAGMRYTVEFFFDGVNVQGTVFGWADPNLATT